VKEQSMKAKAKAKKPAKRKAKAKPVDEINIAQRHRHGVANGFPDDGIALDQSDKVQIAIWFLVVVGAAAGVALMWAAL
jgi:hypothetical protein